MFRDDEMFPSLTSVRHTSDLEDSLPSEQVYVNESFDDVFGSAPSSPTFHEDDASYNMEVSDVPRLREKHETEGYRDGVTKGKGETVQKGFDEGFSLGAVLGLRVGRILGVLEGVVGGVNTACQLEEGKKLEGERERLKGVLGEAKLALKTESLFGREYWGEEGIWTYEVPGEGQEGFDLVFTDVAAAHPLVIKWEGLVEKEVKRWRLDLSIMENGHTKEEIQMKEATQNSDVLPQPTGGVQKKELSW